jgi:TP901 family phage tail tape measure protein
MAYATTDFGSVADDLHRAAGAFALLTSSASQFGASLSAFREFNKQLTMTGAIAQATATDIAKMSKASRDFALVTSTSAVDATRALQSLAQAGFSTQESLAGMNGVLLLSMATMTDVGTAADSLSSAIRAFGLEASDMGRVSNVYVAAMNSSLATMDKLTYSMRQVAPVASVANLSIEQTVAWLDQLYNVGLRGEQAGTGLRNVIVRLIRPTGQAAATLRRLGIATTDATGNMRDLEKIMQDLSKQNLSTAELANIFENEGLAAALAMMKSATVEQGKMTSAYRQNLGQISGTVAALEVALKNMSTYDASMQMLHNAITEIQMTLGEELAPTIEAVAKWITNLVRQFRELSPETKGWITTITAGVITVIGSLSSLNAIMLLFRATGIRSMLALSTAAKDGGSKLTLLGAILSGLIKGFKLLGGAMVAAVAGFASLAAAAQRAVVSMAMFVPGGPVILGLGLIAAGIYAGVKAWDAYTASAKNAAEVKVYNQTKELSQSQTSTKLANIGSPADFSNIDSSMRLGDQLLNNALSKMYTESDPVDAVNVSTRALYHISQARDKLSEDVKALKDAEPQLAALFQARADLLKDLRVSVEAGDKKAAKEAQAMLDGTDLDAETAGKLQAFQDKYFQLSSKMKEVVAGGSKAVTAQRNAILDYLNSLSSGDAEWSGMLSKYSDTLNTGITDGGDRKRVTDIIMAKIEQGMPFSKEMIAQAILEAGGTEDSDIKAFLAPLLQQRVQKQLINVDAAIASVQAKTDQLHIAAKQAQLSLTKDVGEALKLATEIGNADLLKELNSATKTNSAAFDDAINQMLGGLTATLQDAGSSMQGIIDEAANGMGIDPLTLQGTDIGEILNGNALKEAISSQIDSSTTPEEINAIAEAEFAKYDALMTNLVNRIGDALNLPANVLGGLQRIAEVAMENIQATVIAGLNKTTANIQTAEKAATSRAKSGRKSGAKGAANKARNDARKAAKALRDAAKELNDAKQVYTDSVRGLSINERISISLDVDTRKAELEYDAKIAALKQKMEDADRSGNLTTSMRSQYEETLSYLEKTKQAEIDAADSFTEQMKRRSDAIDLFIRDMQDMAAESANTFAKVGAGIAAAFADYQSDLVTLTDITKEAVGGTLDALTSGISDFIFDNENAWENFKQTMLKISQQVFEGFTKSFLQQALSSLTDGGGSIFGNAQQPSSFGSTGTPSVGSGGLLGGIMSALGLGGKSTAKTSNVAPGVVGSATTKGGSAAGGGLLGGITGGTGGDSTDPIAQTMQAAAQKLEQIFTEFATNITKTLNDFGTKFSQALSQAIQSVQSGSGASGGFGGVSFSPVSSSAGGSSLGAISGGGGSGFLGQALGFLGKAFGFADGGQVTGKGTGTSDSILAWLSNKEFVVHSKATEEFLPLLHAINSGKVKKDDTKALFALVAGMGSKSTAAPAFANGGMVNSSGNFDPYRTFIAPTTKYMESAGVGTTARDFVQQQRTVTNSDNRQTTLSVSYNMNGNSGGDGFGRTANQHAKQLAKLLKKAQKNT